MARFQTGVVIVGGSAAGLSAADGLREGGYEGSIIVLDESAEPGFDRPMLSKGLVAAGPGAKPVPLRTPDRLETANITVLAGHGAVGLDIDRRLVVTTDGEAVPWQDVIIATGVDARRLKATSGRVLPALRTLEDLAQTQHLVAEHKSLTIIGGGFIGLEVAAALASTGIDVTVLCPNELPLVKPLGPEVSTWLRDLHQSRGVRLELGVTGVVVDDSGEESVLRCADGRQWTSPAVLAGVGAEPRTQWLVGSGVRLDDGIPTDAAGRTNVPGVWAAGDIARTAHQVTGEPRRFEHWTNAIEQGRHVGLNIARRDAAPFEAVRYAWTEQFDQTIHLFGERDPADQSHIVHGSLASGEFVVVHGSSDELHAVTISGFALLTRTYKKLLRSRASLTEALAVPATA